MSLGFRVEDFRVEGLVLMAFESRVEDEGLKL